jgi:hypothetical protein
MGLDIARLQRQLLAAGTAVAAAARPASGGASGAGPGGVASSQTKAQQQKAYDALFQECRMAETQRDEAINERDALQHNVTRLEAERCGLVFVCLLLFAHRLQPQVSCFLFVDAILCEQLLMCSAFLFFAPYLWL